MSFLIILLCCSLPILVSCDVFKKESKMTVFPFPMKLRGATVQTIVDDDDTLDDVVYFDECAIKTRDKKNVKTWDHWGKWSTCSVTCGIGKMTRWRHCVSEGCSPGEKEAQIKTCTLSPCQ